MSFHYFRPLARSDIVAQSVAGQKAAGMIEDSAPKQPAEEVQVRAVSH